MEEKKESKKEAHKEDGMMMAKKEAGSGDAAMAPFAKAHEDEADGAGDAGGGVPSDAIAPGADGAMAHPDHPDQDEDVELFKSLIQQYLGDDHGQDEEECMKMARESYQEGMAQGMPHEEAMKMAGYGLKCAHMLTKKEHAMHQAASAADALQIHPVDASGGLSGKPGLADGAIGKTKEAGLPPSKAAQSSSKSDDGGDGKEAHKEAAVIRLTAENAQLKESMRRLQVETHLNKLLEGCGMAKKTTNAFRSLVKDKKTPIEIDTAWKTFKEAFSDTTPSSGFMFGIEKETPRAFTRAEGSVVDLSDCTTKFEF